MTTLLTLLAINMIVASVLGRRLKGRQPPPATCRDCRWYFQGVCDRRQIARRPDDSLCVIGEAIK